MSLAANSKQIMQAAIYSIYNFKLRKVQKEKDENQEKYGKVKRGEKRWIDRANSRRPLGFQANLDALTTPSSFRQAPHCLPQQGVQKKCFLVAEAMHMLHVSRVFFSFSETLMYSTKDFFRPHLRVSKSLRYLSPPGNWWQGRHTVAICCHDKLMPENSASSFKSPLL